MATSNKAGRVTPATIVEEFFNSQFLSQSPSDDGTMDYLEYWYKFFCTMKEILPGKEDDHTIKDYLTMFAILPPNLRETEKCDIRADKLRDAGNHVFMLGKDEEAALFYTRSLMTAPAYTKCTALAYANRSAALYRMKAYAECISDTKRSLDLPYPDNLRQKVITRKETAEKNMKEEAEKNINDSRSEDKDEMIEDDLQCAYGPNTKLPEVSKGIDIVYTPQEGQKFVAKMPFHSGDVLIVEKKYLAVPALDNNLNYCHDCLKNSFCLIPCDQCCEVVYCSDECRIRAYENYHRIECKIQSTLSVALPMHSQALLFQLRCLNLFTEQGANLKAVQDDLKEIEDSSDSNELGSTDEQFIPNSRRAFLNLLKSKNPKKKRNCHLALEAAYIVTLLRNHTNFFKQNSDVQVVAEIMAKINSMWPWSHVGILCHGEKKLKAVAAFPLLSLAKHACVNNTITYIDNEERIVMRASQFIRPGDEILYDYQQLHFTFEEIGNRSGRFVQCRRLCDKCDKSFLYLPERRPNIKIDKKLRMKLEKNPYDTEALWKLLNIVRGKYQHFTLQTQIVKVLLIEGYEQRFNNAADPKVGRRHLYMLGVLQSSPTI